MLARGRTNDESHLAFVSNAQRLSEDVAESDWKFLACDFSQILREHSRDSPEEA